MAGKTNAPSKQAAPGPHPGTGGIAPEDNGGARELGRGRVIEIQRSRLLVALFEVSAERGAGNVAVAHIVERAGVSRRTFYELFEDREECCLAAFDDAIARVSRHVLDAYDPRVGWAERIRAALIVTLELLDAERSAAQLLIVGSLGAGSRVIERRQRVLTQAVALIDQGRDETRAGNQLPPLTAEGIVGGVLSVLYSRLLEGDPARLVELAGPLMSMIVLPYLGSAAARRELARPVPKRRLAGRAAPGDPLRDVGMRLTYRTVRVLASVAANPGASNREIGIGAGMEDQGQISKLLARLQRLDLIQNTRPGPARGAPNAWGLTERGWSVQRAITGQSARG
jgi:AcrR family transcriptional regulator